MKKLVLFLLLFYGAFHLYAQIGGSYVYEFLNVNLSPKDAALGSKLVTGDARDLLLTVNNPSLLSEENSNQLAFSYINYFSDINLGYAAFARNLENLGTVSAGVEYLNYGDFKETDVIGIDQGKFTANETAIVLSWSYEIDTSLRVGASSKTIFSNLAEYQSSGQVFDLGASYTNSNKLFQAGIAIRNIGLQITPYADTREPVPFEIIVGISKKLKHAPFKFYLNAHHLTRADLLYNSNKEEENNYFGFDQNEQSRLARIGDNLLRHANVGAEFLPFDNFALRFGYNYQRRKELSIDERTAMVGFSWGFGLKIARFHVNYARASFHLAGASNLFSVSTSL